MQRIHLTNAQSAEIIQSLRQLGTTDEGSHTARITHFGCPEVLFEGNDSWRGHGELTLIEFLHQRPPDLLLAFDEGLRFRR